ncbi:FMN-LINKED OXIDOREDUCTASES SUPERFAMILY PROTEIN [Salix koriyanagi]|uniref:FMN-LINKED OXIDOREDUCTASES SUPERFAMILY PROTEIN n=1 Tax=Salix koriyanagi TaxID=2511006 RepID=A0A9Q0X1K6_9ROSI|nr:FMN-LINKED OXIDOREDUCTASES SUPERFAMILY PROTEIN [Salix koriyanagi]
MGAEQYRPPLFSVAPMMDWTDNHYRTEIWTDFWHFLRNSIRLCCKLVGITLDSIAKATQLANSYGYDEINLNCGCPSPKVAGHGCFGVRLMLDPKFVGEAMSVIAANTDVPVSVKCRIGLDDHDSYNELCDFIYKVSSLSPTKHFIIHSRKALLNGISPADNRRIPPLKYEYYYALLRDFPDLRFTINGGINCVDEQNCFADSLLPYFHWTSQLIRSLNNIKYTGMLFMGTFGNSRPNIRDLIKPLFGFFHSEPGNNLWKRKADAAFQMKNITTVKSFFEETLVAIPDAVLDSHVAELPSGRKDLFANVRGLLPPPYETREEEVTAYA